MSAHLRVERFVRWEADRLVFAAVDGDGPLELLVCPVLWEELQVEAPVHCDADDRRDHALGMIEVAAAGRRADEVVGRRSVRIE